MKWIHGLMMAAGMVAMANTAQAGTVTSGTFTMYDPTGAVVGGSATVTGQMTVGSVTNGLTSPTAFFGFTWTAHDGNMVDNLDGTYSTAIAFHWGATDGIPVTILWDGATGNISALDGDADGIPGNKMTAGPFAGFSPYFNLNPCLSCPEPMSMALVGSALAGLVGLRRKLVV